MSIFFNKRAVITLFIVFSSLLFTACDSTDKSAATDNGEVLENVGLKKFEEIKDKYSDKIILVNFFASWCPPCKSEIPGFIDVYNKHKDRFIIIGLSVDESMQDAVDFVEEMDIPYPTYHAEKALQRKLNISSLPTNIFYAPGGSLFNFYIGALNEDFLENILSQISK